VLQQGVVVAQLEHGMMWSASSGPEYDDAEDHVFEDALKNVSLTVDLSSVHFVEELHHHEGVKDDGVVL